MREGAKRGCPMAAYGAHSEPTSAWGLAKQAIGQGLRERYPVASDLPAALLMLIEKIRQQRVPITTDAIDVASEIRCGRRPSVVAGSRKTSAE
jgi:hypothetical protein